MMRRWASGSKPQLVLASPATTQPRTRTPSQTACSPPSGTLIPAPAKTPEQQLLRGTSSKGTDDENAPGHIACDVADYGSDFGEASSSLDVARRRESSRPGDRVARRGGRRPRGELRKK